MSTEIFAVVVGAGLCAFAVNGVASVGTTTTDCRCFREYSTNMTVPIVGVIRGHKFLVRAIGVFGFEVHVDGEPVVTLPNGAPDNGPDCDLKPADGPPVS